MSSTSDAQDLVADLQTELEEARHEQASSSKSKNTDIEEGLRAELEHMRLEKAGESAEAASYAENAAAAQRELEVMKRQLASVEAERERLASQVADAVHQRPTSPAAVSNTPDAQKLVIELQAELDHVRHEKEKLLEATNSRTSKSAAVEEELRAELEHMRLERAEEAVRANMVADKAVSAQSQSRTMEKQLESIRIERDKLLAAADNSREFMAVVTEELQAVKQEKEQESARAASNEEQAAQAQKQLEAMKEHLQTLETEREQLTSPDSARKLQSELEQVKKEKAELLQSLEARASQSAAVEIELRAKLEYLQLQKHEGPETASAAVQMDLKDLQAELDQLRREKAEVLAAADASQGESAAAMMKMTAELASLRLEKQRGAAIATCSVGVATDADLLRGTASQQRALSQRSAAKQSPATATRSVSAQRSLAINKSPAATRKQPAAAASHKPHTSKQEGLHSTKRHESTHTAKPTQTQVAIWPGQDGQQEATEKQREQDKIHGIEAESALPSESTWQPAAISDSREERQPLALSEELAQQPDLPAFGSESTSGPLPPVKTAETPESGDDRAASALADWSFDQPTSVTVPTGPTLLTQAEVPLESTEVLTQETGMRTRTPSPSPRRPCSAGSGRSESGVGDSYNATPSRRPPSKIGSLTASRRSGSGRTSSGMQGKQALASPQVPFRAAGVILAQALQSPAPSRAQEAQVSEPSAEVSRSSDQELKEQKRVAEPSQPGQRRSPNVQKQHVTLPKSHQQHLQQRQRHLSQGRGSSQRVQEEKQRQLELQLQRQVENASAAVEVARPGGSQLRSRPAAAVTPSPQRGRGKGVSLGAVPPPPTRRPPGVVKKTWTPRTTDAPQEPLVAECDISVAQLMAAAQRGRSQSPVEEADIEVLATACPACGGVYMADAKFCRRCGHVRDARDALKSSPLRTRRSLLQSPERGAVCRSWSSQSLSARRRSAPQHICPWHGSGAAAVSGVAPLYYEGDDCRWTNSAMLSMEVSGQLVASESRSELPDSPEGGTAALMRSPAHWSPSAVQSPSGLSSPSTPPQGRCPWPGSRASAVTGEAPLFYEDEDCNGSSAVYMADSAFCRQCGLEREVQKCPCGNIYMADATFCRKCGRMRSEERSQAAASLREEPKPAAVAPKSAGARAAVPIIVPRHDGAPRPLHVQVSLGDADSA
eukprot:TRINITY_DN3620_c0_g1_i1.p1 TRINITY_DN3620_c0_g1~~TRINITY_DN3620_c0_g1_i1.p1  ORF type:complete len:1240 (+),score=291.68 TRINITY_DN3620_c0_g1_i1:183-3722(+)